MIIDNEHNESRIREDFVIREDSNGTNQPQEVSTGSGSFSYNMDESWVKIHRKILEHWIYKRPEYVSIWLYLIARANWKPTKALVNGTIVTIERGEVLTSIGSLAENTHTSVQTVRTFLKLAQTDEMICVKTNTGATCVKLLNYNKLQQREENDQQAPNKRLTNDQQAPNNIIRKKEYKKVRKEEINIYTLYAPTSSEVVAGLPQNDGQLFPITKDQHDRWQQLYPAVKIKSELSKIIGWLEANPTKRKTKRGMLSFVNRWLSREQDKGAVNAPQATKYTVGDRQAVIDYKTSHKQLEEERDAVAAYLRNQSQPIRYNEVAVPIIRRLGNGEED